MVVDTHDEPTVDSGQQIGEALEIIARKNTRAIHVLASEIWRIEIEERVRPIVSRDEIRIWQALDHHTRQALVNIRQNFAEAHNIETGRHSDREPKTGFRYIPAE